MPLDALGFLRRAKASVSERAACARLGARDWGRLFRGAGDARLQGRRAPTRARRPELSSAAVVGVPQADPGSPSRLAHLSDGSVEPAMIKHLVAPLKKTVLALVNLGMIRPLKALGALSRGITRAIHARAAAKAGANMPDGPSDADLWLVVGLGNPGTRYDGTRHNVGFRAVDEIARQNSIPLKKAKANAQVGLGTVCGKAVLLVKPLTFMNLSGESVGKLSRYYKVPRKRVLVIYDDLDLANAQVKLKLKGGHGGHNGMRSIIEHFGGKSDFPRLRIGIGRPANPRITIVKHVLQRFGREEEEEIESAVLKCAKVVESIMTDGMEKALSTVNQKKKKAPQQQKQKKPAETSLDKTALSPGGQE